MSHRQDLQSLADEIRGLSPADQLRLAADLLDKRPDVAKTIIDRVAVALGAALLLGKPRKAGA